MSQSTARLLGQLGSRGRPSAVTALNRDSEVMDMILSHAGVPQTPESGAWRSRANMVQAGFILSEVSLSGWKVARAFEDQAMNESAKPTVGERAREEFRKYVMVSVYLWICFAVITLYKASVLEEEGISWAPLGFAVVQALVIGKFILIGDALKAGHRSTGHPLLHRIAWRTLAMLLVLIVFKILEEVIVALVHGKPLASLFEELVERPLWVSLAPVLLMLLILVPMITAAEIHRTVGAERFRQMLMG
jgi:hypothetical protein